MADTPATVARNERSSLDTSLPLRLTHGRRDESGAHLHLPPHRPCHPSSSSRATPLLPPTGSCLALSRQHGVLWRSRRGAEPSSPSLPSTSCFLPPATGELWPPKWPTLTTPSTGGCLSAFIAPTTFVACCAAAAYHPWAPVARPAMAPHTRTSFALLTTSCCLWARPCSPPAPGRSRLRSTALEPAAAPQSTGPRPTMSRFATRQACTRGTITWPERPCACVWGSTSRQAS